MLSFMLACTQCGKADLMAFCSHFVLLWIVALSAAAMGMDRRKTQLCSLTLHREVIKVCCPDRTTVRAGTSVPQLSLETSAAKELRNRWRSTYSNRPALCVAKFLVLLRYRMLSIPSLRLWINQTLTALRPFSCVASIQCFFVCSAFLCNVNRVILGTQRGPRTVWDLYYVKFAQRQQLRLKENFHYPLAVYSLRHLAEKLWYHLGEIVCTCFKVSL